MEQLSQAVSLALQAGADPVVKQQAIEFCTQVQLTPQNWWRPALELSGHDTVQETRFFCYQVILVASQQLQDPGELEEIRAALWQRIRQGHTISFTPSLRTKLAEVLVQLFLRLYPAAWPSFFRDLHGLEGAPGMDMYIRVLKVVHEEIGDQLFERTPEQVHRNNQLKDQVRANDMGDLITSWIDMLDDSTPIDVHEAVLHVIAGWVSWIDLPMLLAARDGSVVPRILKHFDAGDAARFGAAEALNEILAKKMAPEIKLELVKHLGILAVLQNFDSRGDEEFEERAAKIANTVGTELVKAGDQGEPFLVELMPTLLQFLGNEYDDTAVQVVPAVSEYVQFIRKETRRSQASNGGTGLPNLSAYLSPERAQILRVLLDKVIARSGHHKDDDDDDDEDDVFAKLREKLRIVQDQIASVDPELFVDTISTQIRSHLGPQAEWVDTELALYELDVLGGVAKTWAATNSKAESPAHRALYDLMTALVGAIDALGPAGGHASVQLWVMELVQRHAGRIFADAATSGPLITKALEFFLSSGGVHNSELRVRVRAWYLLFRLLKTVRQSPLVSSGQAASTVFASVAPLLAVHVSKAIPDQAAGSGSGSGEDDEDSEDDIVFSAQLYLFELVGLLSATQPSKDRAELLRQLLQGLFADVDQSVDVARSNSDPQTVKVAQMRVHHNIMALSAYTRGLGDALAKPMIDGGTEEMQTATQMVVAVVEQLYAAQTVREAARVAISRLVALLGSRILVEISRLIDILLSNARPQDLGDLLSFLGQLAHSFSDDSSVFDMFSSLSVPLLTKVFAALEQAAADVAGTGGTDAAQHRKELVYDYLQFVQNLLNNRFGAMLLPVFENVVQSLFMYASSAATAGEVSNQKVAVIVLERMVQLYGESGNIPQDQFFGGEKVPVFSDGELMAQRLTELCWTLPAKPEFKLRDAQTRLVAIELGGLQKSLWDAGGDDYRAYLANYLAQAGLPPQIVEEFGARAASAPAKDFKRYFYDLLVRAL